MIYDLNEEHSEYFSRIDFDFVNHEYFLAYYQKYLVYLLGIHLRPLGTSACGGH